MAQSASMKTDPNLNHIWDANEALRKVDLRRVPRDQRDPVKAARTAVLAAFDSLKGAYVG